MHLNGEISKMLLNGGKLAGSMQMDTRFMVLKNVLRGVSAPVPGLYTCI